MEKCLHIDAPKKTVSIDILPQEYWYGGAVNDGYLFPLSAEDEYELNVDRNDTYCQINPVYVSSEGRYLWFEGGKVKFGGGKIRLETSGYELCTAGRGACRGGETLSARRHAAGRSRFYLPAVLHVDGAGRQPERGRHPRLCGKNPFDGHPPGRAHSGRRLAERLRRLEFYRRAVSGSRGDDETVKSHGL